MKWCAVVATAWILGLRFGKGLSTTVHPVQESRNEVGGKAHGGAPERSDVNSGPSADEQRSADNVNEMASSSSQDEVQTGTGTAVEGETVSLPPQQYFVVRPTDIEVVEGQTVILQCQIGNLAGAVQWSKHGFLLGYDVTIPGYPRYKMMIEAEQGIFNLEISDVKIDDESEFQCQVGPAENQSPIRSSCNLTVTVPPTVVKINGQTGHNLIEIKESQKLELTCEAGESKPPTALKWYRKTTELISEATRLTVSRATKCGRCRITSNTVVLYPKATDNGTLYSCEATHKAWKHPMKASVVLSVWHKPSFPEISGYREGDVLYAGDSLTLSCVCRGGNPLPGVVWYKDDVLEDDTYVVSGRDVVNVLAFTITPAHNNAVYTCEAKSHFLREPYRIRLKLTVFYPSDTVAISGPKWGLLGETVSLSCQTSPSNPTSQLTWMVNGVKVYDPETMVSTTGQGWVTKSNLSVPLTRQDSGTSIFTCRSETLPMHLTVMSTHEIRVYYAPGVPIITGRGVRTPLNEGETSNLLCTVQRGNPAATLKWYKDDIEVSGVYSENRNEAYSELTIFADRKENGLEFRCEASNVAAKEPLKATVKLRVKFAPRNVSIASSPKTPRAGEQILISCLSDSGNPGPILSWRRNQEELSGVEVSVSESSYGGVRAQSILNLTVTASDDRSVFECLATSQELDKRVRDTYNLRVRHAPVFGETYVSVEMVEGESRLINLTAKANPSDVRYSWTRANRTLPGSIGGSSTSGSARQFLKGVYYEGPLLRIGKVTRQDAGDYVCLAQNSEGSAHCLLKINVLAAPPKRDPVLVDRESELHASVREGGGSTNQVQQDCPTDSNMVSKLTVRWKKKDVEGENESHTSFQETRDSPMVNDVPAVDRVLSDSTSGGSSTGSSSAGIKYPRKCVIIFGNVTDYDFESCECVAVHDFQHEMISSAYFTVLYAIVLHTVSYAQVLKEKDERAVLCCVLLDGEQANVTSAWLRKDHDPLQTPWRTLGRDFNFGPGTMGVDSGGYGSGSPFGGAGGGTYPYERSWASDNVTIEIAESTNCVFMLKNRSATPRQNENEAKKPACAVNSNFHMMLFKRVPQAFKSRPTSAGPQDVGTSGPSASGTQKENWFSSSGRWWWWVVASVGGAILIVALNIMCIVSTVKRKSRNSAQFRRENAGTEEADKDVVSNSVGAQSIALVKISKPFYFYVEEHLTASNFPDDEFSFYKKTSSLNSPGSPVPCIENISHSISTQNNRRRLDDRFSGIMSVEKDTVDSVSLESLLECPPQFRGRNGVSSSSSSSRKAS